MLTMHQRALAVLLLSGALAQAIHAQSSAGQTPGVREVGSQRVLLVDDWLIERMKGASLKLHSPAPKEVVFRFDRPWEGQASAYPSMLQDGKQFRLYYRGCGFTEREYVCVAFSDDGINWTRPSLKLLEFKGSKDNNIFLTAKGKAFKEAHCFAPFIDGNPDCKPDERYKAVTITLFKPEGENDERKTLAAYASPDGIRWNRLQQEPIITEGAFDSHNVAFWDSVQKQYVCYLRAGQAGKRSVARSVSKDFIHWSKPETLDFSGSPIEEFYTNAIQVYPREPHLYIGLPMRFVPPKERSEVGFKPRKTDGLSDAVFMSSHDGQRWHRPFMEGWIRPGLNPNNWGQAHGNQTPAWGVLQTGPEELSVYWMENYVDMPHLRRGTLRLDGFASANALYAGGEFVTRPFTFAGQRLMINFSTSAIGSVQVEIQDADGRPVPGHALADCPEIFGDELERPVGWKAGADISKLAGRPVRLRFVMKDADVYAFRFQ